MRVAWRLLPHERWPLLVGLVLAALFAHDWDGYVFEKTVRDLWRGITPYETGEAAPWYSFLGPLDEAPQWYAYPPLPLLLMAITFLPAVLFDLPEPVQRVLLKLPMVLGHILLARVTSAWADRWRPGMGERVSRWTLWNPFLLLIGPVWGMTDGLMMALVLASALLWRDGELRAAGLLYGAALLVKPFPALLALPLGAWAVRRHGLPHAGKVGAWAAGAFLAVCIPFWLSAPSGFWRQVAGAHLTRGVQGLTVWRWPVFDALSATTIQVASMTLLVLGLVLASIWAAGRRGPLAAVEALLAGGLVVLLTNRVVNEQYLAMAVAPLMVLAARDRVWAALAWTVSAIGALAIVFTGFHFLTFIPPDIALPIFGRPVDAVVESLRGHLGWITGLTRSFGYILPPTLVGATWFLLRRGRDVSQWRQARPSIAAALLLLVVSVGAVADGEEARDDVAFSPALDGGHVAAYYYLWWHNPGRDPDVRYGNWLDVSQSPAIGYYSMTRGIAREHAAQMVDAGIDTAIISYHRGELPLYEVFQEAAIREGLWTMPLIELNQVYDEPVGDRRIHRPVNEDGVEAVYAAYRLSSGAQQNITAFVLDLKEQLAAPNNLRLDGRPAVMFYDAYVSGVSFDQEDKESLAQKVLDLHGVAWLRSFYDDPTITADARELIRYHPASYARFFDEATAAPWRAAHLALHQDFWHAVMADVEAETGPLFWIAGDAYNDRAGFEAGIVQSLVDLDLFDGSFIYSPSFTWGTNQGLQYDDMFLHWEDRNHWMQAFARGQGATSVVGIAPAYDDTVNRPVKGFVIPAEHNGTGTYERSWASALRHAPDMVAIATWNEFFEGSSIEPSKEFGDTWAKETPEFRHALMAVQDAPVQVTYVMGERESRLRWPGSERDLPHEWGLGLIAAGHRVLPGADHAAHDLWAGALTLEGAKNVSFVPAAPPPDLLLVEGARDGYTAATSVGDWLDGHDVPTVVFGPSIAAGVPVDCAVPRLPDGTWGLEPGDRLWQDDGLWLERDGVELLVGARCGDGGVTSFKPYSSGDALVDAACLRVALEALVPGMVAPTGATCRVP